MDRDEAGAAGASGGGGLRGLPAEGGGGGRVGGSAAPVEHLFGIHKARAENGSSTLGRDLREAVVKQPRVVPEGSGDSWTEHFRKELDAAQQVVSAAGSTPVNR
ncbi:hypothetical protein GCM10018790_70060 [Kitasatospora xanthocidica]|nr:hypothetical protein GCM10018790_70060 [Kitasatospora xanthocidica]